MGVPDTGVLFHVIEFPKHGQLSFGEGQRNRGFTLEHLNHNKLAYRHNGLEDVVDSFVFEMEIEGPSHLDLPAALDIRQRFLFEIRVLPVNDPPRLTGVIIAYAERPVCLILFRICR